MPSLTARHCSPELVARVHAFQTAHRYASRSETVRYLIQVALNHLEARSAGAKLVNTRMTPAQRAERAQRAVAARQAKRQAKRHATRMP